MTILTTAQQLSMVILSAFALGIFLWMLMICVPSIRLDIFRQRMFATRDSLFDYARAGNIGFDHPAYRLLRKSMNGFIRYGHRLSFFQLVVTFCRWHYSDEKPVLSWHGQWQEALAAIPDDKVKTELLKFHAESMRIVIERVITGSPILLAATAMSLVASLCRHGWKSSRELRRISTEKTFRLFSIDTDKLEDEALRCAA